MTLLTPQFLVDEVLAAVGHDEQCKDLLLETMKCHLLPERKAHAEFLNCKARDGTIGVIYAVGGMRNL